MDEGELCFRIAGLFDRCGLQGVEQDIENGIGRRRTFFPAYFLDRQKLGGLSAP